MYSKLILCIAELSGLFDSGDYSWSDPDFTVSLRNGIEFVICYSILLNEFKALNLSSWEPSLESGYGEFDFSVSKVWFSAVLSMTI